LIGQSRVKHTQINTEKDLTSSSTLYGEFGLSFDGKKKQLIDQLISESIAQFTTGRERKERKIAEDIPHDLLAEDGRRKSSSRLNHRLPWRQTYAKVMQPTADFHDPITDTRLPQAAGVVDNATALDTTVDVLNAHATAGDPPIRGFLGAREGPSSRFSGRHDGFNLIEGEGQEAEILEQPAACGQGVRRGIGNPLVMGAPRIGGTQQEDGERRVDQQHIFHRMAFLLAAIIARLLSRILGMLDAPFGAIVATRGEAGAGAGGSPGVSGSLVGTTSAVASASATPRRFASAVTDRVGASPSVRSVACSTTKRT
jgi:hypothetical protein